MPVYTSTTGAGGLLPADYGQLVVQPALGFSVFAEVATVVTTGARDYRRIPLVTADPTALWVNEGQEITPSDPTLAELVVTPPKVAGLTVTSREMADDSDPEVQGRQHHRRPHRAAVRRPLARARPVQPARSLHRLQLPRRGADDERASRLKAAGLPPTWDVPVWSRGYDKGRFFDLAKSS